MQDLYFIVYFHLYLYTNIAKYENLLKRDSMDLDLLRRLLPIHAKRKIHFFAMNSINNIYVYHFDPTFLYIYYIKYSIYIYKNCG